MPPRKKAEPTPAEAKAAEKALEAASKDAEQPAEVRVHEDETKENRTPGFTRMRLDWHGPDAQMLASILSAADNQILVEFGDAYRILNDVYEIVREPRVDKGTGEIVTDERGWALWETTESGRIIEDYSRLGIKEREQFLLQITARLVDWEQRAADAWGEAMFAKAQWEERFSDAFFEAPEGGRKTDESMTQRARQGSRDERYFAIYKSYCSRKADALMRSLERLAQRLKDSLA